jgi:hypothetical protein
MVNSSEKSPAVTRRWALPLQQLSIPSRHRTEQNGEECLTLPGSRASQRGGWKGLVETKPAGCWWMFMEHMASGALACVRVSWGWVRRLRATLLPAQYLLICSGHTIHSVHFTDEETEAQNSSDQVSQRRCGLGCQSSTLTLWAISLPCAQQLC